MARPLAQRFNELAAEAYASFPTELARLVVLLIPDGDTPVYVSPAVAKKLTQDTAAIKKATAEIGCRMDANAESGLAFRDKTLAGTTVNMIALDSRNTSLPSRRYTKSMQGISSLNHELGHLILRNGSPFTSAVSQQGAESAADVFALLRHIQLFGNGTAYARNSLAKAAGCIILLSDTEHYTAHAIERAMEAINGMGGRFFTLSLRETAELAAQIADDSRLDDMTLEKIREAYLPVKRILDDSLNGALKEKNTSYDEDICRQTLAIMKENRHDPAIFNAGKWFLGADRRKKYMQQAAETDKAWKEALTFIRTHNPATPVSKCHTAAPKQGL